MKSISEKLASLTFTTAILMLLLLWLAWGIILSNSASFSVGFQEMNRTILREWLFAPGNGSSLLRFWFIGLCLVMIVLGVNLVECSWLRIFKILRAKFSTSRLLMLVVHIFFGLVALAHLGGLMVGYRYEDIRLAEGQAFQTEDGYEVRVERIHFKDNPDRLPQPPFTYPSYGDHPGENYAEVSITLDGKEIQRDRNGMFDPLRYKALQITLMGLVSPVSPPGGPAAGERKPDTILVISKNPVIRAFLAIYPFMMAGIIIHLMMTWRETDQRK